MLELKHVSTTSGPVNGLSDVSFSLDKGEIVVVIGPNGSGKSLLCRAIADPDIRMSGEIIINHFNARKERDKAKHQVGYAAAGSSTEPYLTGFEYLEMIGSFCHLSAPERSQRILALARTFRCLDELYSLGERQSAATNQKINLIASLLAAPPLLVWDEPTEFLDEFGRQAALQELASAVKAGSSALVATNDLTLAATIADRLLVLDRGQLITEGTPSQLEHLAGSHKKGLAATFAHLLADA